MAERPRRTLDRIDSARVLESCDHPQRSQPTSCPEALLRILRATANPLSLDKDAPISRPIQPPVMGRIMELPQVGGLHHRYERIAA
jgi:hypothetical protein